MKKITALFMAFMFIISTFGIQNAAAADNFNWNNLKAEYTYNSSRDDLEIKIFLPNITRSPDEIYELEVEIDNRDYDKRMSYSSSRDEIYATFDFDNINSNELEDYLDLDIMIEDEDRDEVFDGRIEMSSKGSTNNNNDDLDWDDLEVSYTYSESSERLVITVLLEDVNSSPRYTYTAQLESDGRDYQRNMSYSSSRDELKTTFTINNVDEDDLEDYLEIELEIEDSQNDTVYREDIDLDDNNSSNSNDDNDFNWSELQYSIVYEQNNNRLNFRLNLNDIDDAGDSDEYDIIVTIDGNRYNLNLFYSNPNNNLYTNKYIPVFNASRVMSSYNVAIQVRDEDNDIVYSTTKRLVTNAASNTTSTGTNTTTNTITNDEIEVKAFRYIYTVEQRFTSPIARAAYLNRTIAALESAKYSLNTTVVDGIIKVLRERIASYNTGTTSSGNTNTGNTYTPTPTRVNKAESIRSDGQGGTFKYVGGYNY